MGKYDFDDDDDDEFDNVPKQIKNPRDNPFGGAAGGAYDPNAALRSIKLGLANEQAAPLVSEAQRVKRYKEDNGCSYVDEGLDDNFETTPWLPPNIVRAQEYRFTKVYKGARFDKIPFITTSDFPIGLNYHFMFLKSMSFGLIFMTLACLPTLIVAYFGMGVPNSDYDLLSIEKLTIGNIGNELSEGTVQCQPSQYATANDSCIIVLNSYELPFTQISLMVTILEIIQVFIFLIAVCHLTCVARALEARRNGKSSLSATDYTVLVSGLPKNTTEAELIEHFSTLYQLAAPDWRGRLPVEDARPVQFCDNSGDPTHVGSWVAECTLHKKIGPFIDASRRLVQMLETLYVYKAKMKLHDTKSPYNAMINKEEKVKAEAAMIEYAHTIDQFIERKNKQFGIAQPPPPPGKKEVPKVDPAAAAPAAGETKEGERKEGEEGAAAAAAAPPPVSSPAAEKGKSGKSFKKKKAAEAEAKKKAAEPAPAPTVAEPPKDVERALTEGENAPFSKIITKPHKINRFKTTCAFVCFEYNESFARCVEDHAWYTHFPLSLLTPLKMRFKGRALSVRKAPRPQEIIWENIDVSTPWKLLLKLRTVLVGLVLICISLAVLLYAAHYRNLFTNHNVNETPDMCYRQIPPLFTTTASLAYDPDIESKLYFSRPDEVWTDIYDNQCRALIPDSFYLTMKSVKLIDHIVYDAVPYSFAACANQTANNATQDLFNGPVCPAYNATSYCPCVTTHLKTGCETKACSTGSGGSSNDDGKTCITYAAGDIGTCYCREVLAKSASSISGYFALLAAATPGSTPGTGMCEQFNAYWAMSEGVLYVAILVTSVIQAILRRTVAHLVRLECHTFKDDLQRSLFYKTFIATYLNIAVVILIAFGNNSHKPPILTTLNLFNGPYFDFSSEWYGSVGFYLVLTFVLNIAAPIVLQFFKFFVGKFLYTYWIYDRIYVGKNSTVLIQHQLDLMEVGAVFDTSVNTAQHLARLFIAMTFAPGMPLMTIVCCVAFISHFHTDKFMMSYYNEKPKALSAVVMKMVLALLPCAAVLRLCFGAWMYGAPGVLAHSFDPVEGASASAGGVDTSVISLYSYMLWVEGLQRQSYLPASAAWIWDRITLGNVLPLIIFLVLILAVMAVQYLVPFGLMWRGLKAFYKLCKRLCGPKSKLVKSKGFVHPYELVFSDSQLRKEAAPYTGNYFKYMPPNAHITGSGGAESSGGKGRLAACTNGCFACADRLVCGLCSRRRKGQHTFSVLELLGEDWEEANVNNFECYVKVWPATSKSLDGSTKMKGDHKKTYEVVRDNGSYSYDLEKIPGYSIPIVAWREFTPNPVLYDYFKRFPERNPEFVAKRKAAEEAAKRAEKDFMKDVAASLSEVSAANEAAAPKKKRKRLGMGGVEEAPAEGAAAGDKPAEETKPEAGKAGGWMSKMFGKRSAKTNPGAVVPGDVEAGGDALKESVSGKNKTKPGAAAKNKDESSSGSGSGSESGSESGSGSGSGSSSGSDSGSGSESGSGSGSESEEG